MTEPSIKELTRELEGLLEGHLSPATRRAVLNVAHQQTRVGQKGVRAFLREVRRGVQTFGSDEASVKRCLAALDALLPERGPATVKLSREGDVSAVCAMTRDRCNDLGFRELALTKVVTAVSELVRNAVMYGGGGEVTLRNLPAPARGFEAVVRDQGPGIPNLEEILAGRYRSKSGRGVGLRGAKALADELEIETRIGAGTTITFRKLVS